MIQTIGVAIFVAVVVGVPSIFFMQWPWQASDKRKLAQFLAEMDARHLMLRGRCWQRWERVGLLRWVPCREYHIHYTDPSGRERSAHARFYLPPWLNVSRNDPEFEGNFDFIEHR